MFRSSPINILIIVLLAAFLFFRQEKIDAEIVPPQQFVYAPQVIKNPEGSFAMIGTASWYSRRSPGIRKHTANNEIFDENSLTCAIWGRSFNSKVRVTNLENGRSVILRVNDRGPHIRYFREGRIIDLTKAAFKEISNSKKGLIRVQVDFL